MDLIFISPSHIMLNVRFRCLRGKREENPKCQNFVSQIIATLTHFFLVSLLFMWWKSCGKKCGNHHVIRQNKLLNRLQVSVWKWYERKKNRDFVIYFCIHSYALPQNKTMRRTKAIVEIVAVISYFRINSHISLVKYAVKHSGTISDRHSNANVNSNTKLQSNIKFISLNRLGMRVFFHCAVLSQFTLGKTYEN